MSPLHLKALVVSPSATHPRDYGNRNRVFQTADFLRRCGYEVHFVLYPMEEDWARSVPNSAKDMQAYWTSFHVVPPSLELHSRAAGQDHTIDEWWDPALEAYLRWLFQRQAFDLIFVNYTFLSKAFELCGPRAAKILDTHDKFAGRRQMLEAGGVEPEFFYTTVEQERIAFDRADVVVAIKESEAEVIRSETSREVITLPFYPDYLDTEALNVEPTHDDEIIRFGFIGADNSVNAVNMAHFIREFERLQTIYAAPIELVVAGNVCRRLHSEDPSVTFLGRVASIEDFYNQVDVVVAPLMFSTGIKIKVGEALAFGKPVLSTANGYDGFPITDPYQSLPDIKALGKAMLHLGYDPERLRALKRNSGLAAILTKRRCLRALESIAETARRRRRRIIFVTDQPFFRNDSLQHARLHQWGELCSFMMQTIVLSTAPLVRGETLPLGLPYEWVSLAGPDGAVEGTMLSSIEALGRQCSSLEVILACDAVLLESILSREMPKGARLWIDTSVPSAFLAAKAAGLCTFPGDIALIGPDGSVAAMLRPTPLRYRNTVLDHVASFKTPGPSVLAGCAPSAEHLRDARKIAASVGADIIVLDNNDPGKLLENVVKNKSRPKMVIAFGNDDRLVALLRAACRVCEIQFADASTLAVPGRWGNKGGGSRVYNDFSEMLKAILANPEGNLQRQAEATDTGWSSFWARVSKKVSEGKVL